MDNIPMNLNESNDSSVSDSSESLSTSLLLLSSSQIFTERFFSQTSLVFLFFCFFCPPYTIAIASSARRTFASLSDVFSFVLRSFRFFELVNVFNAVYVYL